MEHSRILMITTGGTIASRLDPHTGAAVPASSGSDLIGALPELSRVADCDVIDFSLIGSWDMTPLLHYRLARLILERLEDAAYDGVVITHGTDTLEETAFSLDLLLDVHIPVVLTGAMLHSTEVGADGPRNLLAAARVAVSDMARGLGVCIVLNQEIHAARWAMKLDSNAPHAFGSPNYGAIGRVDGEVVTFRTLRGRPRVTIPLTEPKARVILIRMAAGLDVEPYLYWLNTGLRVDGFVIEAFGSGNIFSEWESFLHTCFERDVPVVLCSRCLSGPLTFSYGGRGGGLSIAEVIIPASYLPGPKARLALIFALSSGYSRSQLIQLFQDLSQVLW